MKHASTPRRIYVNSVDCHLSYLGQEFGRVGTKLDPAFPVTITGGASAQDATEYVKVSQRKPHRRRVTEAWFAR